MTAIAILRREEIIQRVASGEFITKISRELGLAPSTLSEHLRGDQEYLKAREIGMEVRLEKAGEEIEDAGDDLNLARVREISARRTEWRAEREFPHRWGQKQEVKVTHTHTADGALSDAAADLLAAVREIKVLMPGDDAKLVESAGVADAPQIDATKGE